MYPRVHDNGDNDDYTIQIMTRTLRSRSTISPSLQHLSNSTTPHRPPTSNHTDTTPPSSCHHPPPTGHDPTSRLSPSSSCRRGCPRPTHLKGSLTVEYSLSRPSRRNPASEAAARISAEAEISDVWQCLIADSLGSSTWLFASRFSRLCLSACPPGMPTHLAARTVSARPHAPLLICNDDIVT